MPSVVVDRFRDLSSALRKLKRSCEKIGTLRAKKEDRYHEKRSDKKRKCRAAAKRRTAKNKQRENLSLRRPSKNARNNRKDDF